MTTHKTYAHDRIILKKILGYKDVKFTKLMAEFCECGYGSEFSKIMREFTEQSKASRCYLLSLHDKKMTYKTKGFLLTNDSM